LGLIGFVFPTSAKSFVFIILCFNRAYVHLAIQQIGFDWVCFGFVFPACAEAFISIILCYNSTYVHLSIQQIGFVLHKTTRMVEIRNPNIEIRNNIKI